MELGIYSFGDVQKDPVTGQLGSTAEATRNLLEAIELADQVGLDYFGIGEHHTREMPASAAATILAAAAVKTSQIRLGSSVTVLSTDDPVRVYQQFATVDALSHGRAEITAGRGSSTESFPLFGYDLVDYDALYAEKLDLLLEINEHDAPLTWHGQFRPSLTEAVIVPRAEQGKLPIWLATGGSPGSSVRAGQLHLPIAYAIIGGQPHRFAPLAELYRQSAARSGAPTESIRIAVASPGFIGDEGRQAKNLWAGQWKTAMDALAPVRGFTSPPASWYEAEMQPGGALFVGDPEEIAERIITLHSQLGHMRQFFQMDIGHLPQKDFLHGIELLGTRVKPLVDQALGPVPERVSAKGMNGAGDRA